MAGKNKIKKFAKAGALARKFVGQGWLCSHD
jgi:hypothetical protein